jgi:hypothetical protein
MDDRDSRRVDGLLASYGELGRDMSALQERVAGAAREREGDLRRIEGLIAELREDLRAAVATWRTERLDDKKAAAQSARDAVEARRWSRGQWIAILGPTVGMITVAIALLQGPHP